MGSNPIGSTRIVVIQPSILTKRILIIAALVLGLLYCGDYVYVRIRMRHPKPDDPFESLKTLRLLAIPEKGGKTSYEIDQQNPEQTITCVHSVFPHAGYFPCWYVKPRINQPIPMTIIRVSMNHLKEQTKKIFHSKLCGQFIAAPSAHCLGEAQRNYN